MSYYVKYTFDGGPPGRLNYIGEIRRVGPPESLNYMGKFRLPRPIYLYRIRIRHGPRYFNIQGLDTLRSEGISPSPKDHSTIALNTVDKEEKGGSGQHYH